jgi:hypothetical protein
MVMPDGSIGGFYTLSSTALRLVICRKTSPEGCRAIRWFRQAEQRPGDAAPRLLVSRSIHKTGIGASGDTRST